MKAVYICISGENDLYLEQTYLSIMSFKEHNRGCDVLILTDKSTSAKIRLYSEVKELKDIAVQYIDMPKELDGKDKSSYLKTNLYSLVDDDFIFIDSDTVVCEEIPFDEMKDIKVGAVKDKHYFISTHPLKHALEKNATRCGFHAGYSDIHFNSGVIVVNRSEEARLFFDSWYKNWEISRGKQIKADQPSFNEANYSMNGIIIELPGEFNCQLSNITAGAQYIDKAIILHYFASYGRQLMPYDVANLDLSSVILDKNRINTILNNPKAMFESTLGFVSDYRDMYIMESFGYKVYRRIYNNKKIFMAFEFISRCIWHLIKNDKLVG